MFEIHYSIDLRFWVTEWSNGTFSDFELAFWMGPLGPNWFLVSVFWTLDWHFGLNLLAQTGFWFNSRTLTFLVTRWDDTPYDLWPRYTNFFIFCFYFAFLQLYIFFFLYYIFLPWWYCLLHRNRRPRTRERGGWELPCVFRGSGTPRPERRTETVAPYPSLDTLSLRVSSRSIEFSMISP